MDLETKQMFKMILDRFDTIDTRLDKMDDRFLDLSQTDIFEFENRSSGKIKLFIVSNGEIVDSVNMLIYTK